MAMETSLSAPRVSCESLGCKIASQEMIGDGVNQTIDYLGGLGILGEDQTISTVLFLRS